jgi:chaperonin GroEL
MGVKLQSAELSSLGRAKRIVIAQKSTTIVGGGGSKEAVDKRVQLIRRQMSETTSDYDKEKLGERLAKLLGGVAAIRVGAPTESEMKRRKEAFEDAISATKAAVDEGLVPGGGYALLQTTSVLREEEEKCTGDERTGLQILCHAMQRPARQIAENSGLDGGVVVARMDNPDGIGLNAATGDYVDLVASGIVDPTKVVRIALENAVSVASLLLLTEATLTDIPEAEEAEHHPSVEGLS